MQMWKAWTAMFEVCFKLNMTLSQSERTIHASSHFKAVTPGLPMNCTNVDPDEHRLFWTLEGRTTVTVFLPYPSSTQAMLWCSGFCFLQKVSKAFQLEHKTQSALFSCFSGLDSFPLKFSFFAEIYLSFPDFSWKLSLKSGICLIHEDRMWLPQWLD